MQQNFVQKNANQPGDAGKLAENLAGTSSLSVDPAAKAFEEAMAKYFAECKHRIKKVWRVPNRTTSLRIETTFRIHRDGSTTNIMVTKSSGSKFDDENAVQAIKNVRLDRPPAGCAEYYDINFVFELSPTRQVEERVAAKFEPPKRKIPALPVSLPVQAPLAPPARR